MALFHPRLNRRLLLRAIGVFALFLCLCLVGGATARAQEASAAASLTGATQVAVGGDFACALIEDGTVWCWGRGFDGQLGDGRQLDSLVPVQALGIEDAVKISAGDQHACALRANGRTSCWGYYVSGALGHALGGIVATPTDVPWAYPALDVAAGGWQICTLLVDGRVRCWEQWRITDTVLMQTAGVYPGAVALAGSQWMGCVLMENGDVNCWVGQDSQPGPNGDYPRREYVRRDRILEGASEIAVYGGRSCGVVDGELWCWGMGWSPDLSSEDPEDMVFYDEPVLMDGIENVAGIALDIDLCARTAEGEVYCKVFNNDSGWSAQQSGETVDIFRQVADIENALGIARGRSSACAVVDAEGERRVRCWGSNGMGQLGNGTSTSVDTPVLVAETEGAQALALAGDTTCALLENGDVVCWGMPGDPEWGGESSMATYSATLQSLLAPATAIGGYGLPASSYPSGSLFPPTVAPYQSPNRVCAAHEESTFSCAWESLTLSYDDNGIGQQPSRTVTETTPIVQEVVQLAVGEGHQCALTEREDVFCFGRNQWGQTGIDTRLNMEGQAYTDALLDIPLPQPVPGMTDVVDISASEASTCAVKRDGSVWCWGVIYGADGEFVPYPGYVARPQPSRILAGGARRVSVNGFRTCAAMGDEGALCWGPNENGSLGVVRQAWLAPTRVAGLDVVDDVAVGGDQSCFLSQGEVWCVGVTTRRSVIMDGQMRVASSAEAFQIDLPGPALTIEAGNGNMCAIAVVDDHTQVACWGWNDAGQVGANPGWDPVEVKTGG